MNDIRTLLVVLLFLSCAGCKEGRQEVVEEYSLDTRGTLKLAYRLDGFGPVGGKWYRKEPVLYFNGKVVESEYSRRSYSNTAAFPKEADKLSSFKFVDFRDQSKVPTGRRVVSPDKRYRIWIIYVYPEQFSEGDFDNIVAIFKQNRSEINAELSECCGFDEIGVIAYTREFAPERYFGPAYTINIFPNGLWFEGDPWGTHGSPGGKLSFGAAKPMFEVPCIKKNTFDIYNKGKPFDEPYNPHFLRFHKNVDGRAIEDNYEIREVPCLSRELDAENQKKRSVTEAKDPLTEVLRKLDEPGTLEKQVGQARASDTCASSDTASSDIVSEKDWYMKKCPRARELSVFWGKLVECDGMREYLKEVCETGNSRIKRQRACDALQ